jgi:outer membrane protein OmpA-like peptidoglycan-associated protein
MRQAIKNLFRILVFIGLACLPHVCLFAQSNILNSTALKTLRIRNEAGINTANLEFSPGFYRDYIAFVHAEAGSKKKSDPEIKEPFFDLVYASVGNDGKLNDRKDFPGRINSQYHEGPICWNANEQKLYFTRAGIEKKRVKGIDRDTSVRKIMIADMGSANPSVQEFNLNSTYYSVCHPALSEDGKTMIFSSDKPGGFGGMDLYAAYFDGTRWTGMINLGPNVNSDGHDVFPALWNDSLLIFASDKSGGVGGFDIYFSKIDGGLWSPTQHIGQPLNTAFDDFGLIVFPDGKSGYFSSNRPGGKGKDDIYSISVKDALFAPMDQEQTIELSLNIMDKFSFLPVKGALVKYTELNFGSTGLELENFNTNIISGGSPGNLILKISPKQNAEMHQNQSGESGFCLLTLKEKHKYLITVESDEHEAFTIIYDSKTYGHQLNIILEPTQTDVPDDDETDETISNISQEKDSSPIPTAVGSRIVFDQIYFSYNSAEIQDGAASELDQLAETLVLNPNMLIRLESHTDSRGNDIYNKLLSVRRAEAAKNYLVEKGIAHDRIETVGMGESRIRNHCKDGVSCSEKEHRYNRRTEVIIVQN